MNFKTTIVLLLVVAVVGTVLLLNRGKSPDADKGPEANPDALVQAEPKDVSRVAVTSADGKELVLEKVKDQWRLSKPVDAAAEAWEVDALINAIIGSKSRSKTELTAENAKATGLEQPRFLVELWAGDKHWKLAVGEKSAVGDGLYVRLNDNAKADLIGADLYDKLDRPANALRKVKLVDAGSAEIKQVEVSRAGEKLALERSGEKWQIIEPVKAPADAAAVDDLLMAVTGLQASEFVSEKASDAAAYQLDKPRVTVRFTTAAPATQPSTQPATQPAWVTVKVGRYDDVLKKNVFVTVGDSPAIAKVPATLLDSLNKKPLDLRDKQVLAIESDRVSRLSVKAGLPTTTQPTGGKQIVLARRKEKVAMGPELPTTKPTTKAATQPAAPASKWVVESDAKSSANDENITALLGDLNALRAERFIEKFPSTQPADQLLLQVTTEGPGGTPVTDHAITLSDPGNGQPVVASYNGLVFEVSRTLLDHAKAELAR